MSNGKLKEYRTKLFTDLYTNVVPDRVPISDAFTIEFFIQNAKKDLVISQYDMSKEMLEETIPPVMEFAKGDMVSINAARNATGIMFQQSIINKMGETGTIQHPEVSIMDESEYDEYIANPYDFTQSVLEPRSNLGWNKDPVLQSLNRIKYVLSSIDHNKVISMVNNEMAEKYSLYQAPAGVSGRQPIPFDTLADMIRGFSNIAKDIKRRPTKVLDAMEALMPYCIWQGSRSKAHPLGANSTMTHMAAFLRTSEFEKFYWPKFAQLVHISAERGQQQVLFCEDDWTRFVDYLQDLPQGTRIFMEYGDPKVFKEKLGKKLVLGGFYPLTLLRNGTKEQCLDKAKELIDILAPGGNYYFRTDKSILTCEDINVDNYVAVMEYVQLNTKYDNAGQLVSTVKKDDTIIKGYKERYPEFKSKYIISFDDFIKEYPPIDERAIPIMREKYDKYSKMAEVYFV